MDLLAELLIGIQSLVAIAMIPLFVLSRRTSRSKHSRHETFQAITIFLLGLTSVAALAAVYGLGTTDRPGYLLAAFIPFISLTLGAIVIVRASQANAISHRRRRT